jgi:hypothetical protein
MIPALLGGAAVVGTAKALINKASKDREARDNAQTAKEQGEKAGAGRGKQGGPTAEENSQKLKNGGVVKRATATMRGKAC